MTDPSILLDLLIIGLKNGAMIALVAIGVTLVYGTVRTLNLAHGDVFALTTVFVTTIISGFDLTPDTPLARLVPGLGLTLVCAMGFGAVLNTSIERLAFKPFRGMSRLAPLIATLGISFVLYQVSLIWRVTSRSWVPHEHRSVPGLPEVPTDRIPDFLPNFDLVQALGLPFSFTIDLKDILLLLLGILFAIGVALFLRRTRAGRAIRACSENAQLAELCGINYDRSITATFALGGALAGAAAFAFALYYARPFGQHGAQSGLIAFAAAILGGVGSPIGALTGGLLLGVIGAYSDFFLNAQWTPVVVFGLLITMLVLRPGGVAGSRESDDKAAPVARDAITVFYRGATGRRGLVMTLGAIALMIGYPFIEPALNVSLQVTFTSVMIFVLLALGLTVLLGFAGLLDLGYAVSFGIGAYTAAMLTTSDNPLRTALGLGGSLDILVIMAASALMAAVFGVVNAVLVDRMRNDYLAVVTLAFGLMVKQTIINASDLTGGNGGLAALPQPVLFGQTLSSPTARYFLLLACVVVVAAGVQRLIRSRTGRAFMAIGEDEVAASASGVNVAHYKRMAFILGTAIAGLAGALYAASISYVDPDVADFRISMMVLAMVIVSGAGSVPGAIIGATVISLYDKLAIPLVGDWLSRSLGSQFDIRQVSYLTFGLALYLTVLLRARRRGSGREAAPPDFGAPRRVRAKGQAV